jgi:hypothetical protein
VLRAKRDVRMVIEQKGSEGPPKLLRAEILLFVSLNPGDLREGCTSHVLGVCRNGAVRSCTCLAGDVGVVASN